MSDEHIPLVLKALAEYDRACEASPATEVLLRREFRRHRTKRSWRRRAIWTGTAAAVIVGTLVFASTRRAGNVGPTVAVHRTVETVNPTVPYGESTVKSTVANGDFTVKSAVSRRAATKPPKTHRDSELVPPIQQLAPWPPAIFPSTETPGAEIEMVTDFFPLMNPEPPFERGEILRVNLPASVMQSVGLPVRADRMGDRVQADVLVGEEGLARAIRFVRTDAR